MCLHVGLNYFCCHFSGRKLENTRLCDWKRSAGFRNTALGWCDMCNGREKFQIFHPSFKNVFFFNSCYVFPRLLLENAIIKRDFGIQLEGQIVTRSSVYALRCLYVCVSVFMCAPRNLSRGGERVSTSSRRPGVSAHDSECSLDNL